MKRTSYINLSFLLLVALIGTGCGKKTIVSQDGVTVTEENKGSYTITDNTGSTVKVGGEELPSDFPSDAPIYSGASIAGSTAAAGSYTATMGADANVDTVKAWYLGELKKAGWTMADEFAIGGGVMLSGTKTDGSTILVSMGPNDQTTVKGTTVITIVRSAGTN